MNVHLYGLIDPRDNRIKYVGQTVNLDRRYKEHCAIHGSTAKDVWISELAGLDLKPILVHLETVSGAEANHREAWWIELLKVAGSNLTNTGKPVAVEYDYSWFFQNRIFQNWEYGKKMMAGIISFVVASTFFLITLQFDPSKVRDMSDAIAIAIVSIALPPGIFFCTYLSIVMIPLGDMEPPSANGPRSLGRWVISMIGGDGSTFIGLIFIAICGIAFGIFHSISTWIN